MAMPKLIPTNVDRKYLAVYVKSADMTDWSIQGRTVASAMLEFAVDKATSTDILSITDTKINKIEPSISFEPTELSDSNQLYTILMEYTRRKKLAELAEFKVLVVYGFMNYTGTEDGTYCAETYDKCTISTDGVGGEGNVTMNYTIDLGGEVVYGTTDIVQTLDPVAKPITFTPEQAGA